MDPELVERRRLQEAEEWRLQQLRSGASDENPNLQASHGSRLCRAHVHSVCITSGSQCGRGYPSSGAGLVMCFTYNYG